MRWVRRERRVIALKGPKISRVITQFFCIQEPVLPFAAAGGVSKERPNWLQALDIARFTGMNRNSTLVHPMHCGRGAEGGFPDGRA